MRKMKELFKKVFSLVIVTALIVTGIPTVAFYADTTVEEQEEVLSDVTKGENSNETITLDETIENEEVLEGATAQQSQRMPYDRLMPSTGDVKALVFLVDFPDCRQTDGTTAEEKEEELFDIENEDSFSGFYHVSSYGKLNIDGDVYGYYTTKNEREYYDNPNAESIGRQELVNELLEYYDDEIDFSDYDADKDGYIDALYIEYAGPDNGWGNFWWSYMCSWESFVEQTEADGVLIQQYVWMNADSSNVDTYKHETGHLLGLIDYYDSETGQLDGALNTFDMMHGNIGDHNAVSKILLGWLEPIEINNATELELGSSQLFPDAAIVYPNGDTTSEEYFVVEYITSDKANVDISHLIGDGGIRVWRVNARLTEDGTGYVYNNNFGTKKFLEAVGICDYSLGTDSYGNTRITDADASQIANLYYEGDELTPYSTPSSYIYGDSESYYGPFTSSGVVLKDIRLDGKKAIVQISYDNEGRQDFEYSFEYDFESMLWAEFSFDYETTLVDTSKITVSNGEEEIEIDAEIIYLPDYGFKKLFIFSREHKLTENGSYTLTIEEGALVNEFGVYNPKITEEIVAQAIGSALIEEYERTDVYQSTDQTEMISINDTVYFFNKYGNELSLISIYKKNENTLTARETLIWTNDDSNYMSAHNFNGKLLLKVVDGSNLCSIYLVNTDGTYSLLWEDEYSSNPEVFVLGENVVVNSRYENIKLITPNTEEIKEFEHSYGNRLEGIWEAGHSQYIAVYEKEFVLVDEQFNTIKKVLKNNISPKEKIVDIFDKNEYITMLVEENDGMDTDLSLVYFDTELNYVKREKVLNDTFSEIANVQYVVQKYKDGYIVRMDCTNSMMRFSKCLQGEDVGIANSIVSSTKIAYFDANWNYVTSKQFWGRGPWSISASMVEDTLIYYNNGVSLTVNALDDVNLDVSNRNLMNLQLSEESVQLSVDEVYQLREKYDPYNVIAELEWTSSDTSVVTVDEKGIVTAVGVGNAIITVTEKNSGDSTNCEITVTEKQITKISLNKRVWGLMLGETETLTATITPDNMKEKNVIWTSSDENIVTVSEDGVITTVGVGTATITAMIDDKCQAVEECTVVVKPVEITSIRLEQSSVDLKVGENYQFKVIIEPENVTNKAVMWESSDETIITINDVGVVTAVGVGTATIKVTALANGWSTVGFVRVGSDEEFDISTAEVSKVENQTYTGSAITPSVTVKDGDTTLVKDTDYTVSYSNNVNVGTATVTITGKGNYSGTKEVTFTITEKSLANVTVLEIANQTYTGSAITPSVTVIDGDTTLVKGSDYTVSYSNNVTVGTATVTITGKGNYGGTKEVTFTITEKSLTNATVLEIANQTFTGSAITPSITVTDGNKILVKDTDYTVSYSNNVNTGTATVTITGKGNYGGTKEVTFTITEKSLTNATVLEIANQTFTGSAITPSITVTDGNKILVKDTDYTVSYSNNVNTGTATVTITGKGNYSGTKEVTFTITEKSLANVTVLEIANQTYTGSAITPSITVKDGDTTLVKDTDYTVSYSNNVNEGTATVTITGKGNYSGTKEVTFTIVSKSLVNATVSDITNQSYTGSAITPSVTVKDGDTTLVKDIDYTVSYSNNVNVGTATVTITGKGNYSGTKEVTFTIVSKSLANAIVSDITNQSYTGSAITPSVTVKDGDTTLMKDTDYTVSYSNNVNVGIATVTITGIGNYSGTKEVTFTIVSKSLANATVSSIANQTYTGSAITPSVTVTDGNTTLVKDIDYTVSYSNNVNVGTATVTITGKGNYSGTKTVTFTIVKQEAPKPEMPTQITSSSMNVNESMGCISKITIGTTIMVFRSGLNEKDYVKVYQSNQEVADNAVLATGMQACVMNGNTIVKKYDIIVTGDTNGDGKMNITDMIAIKANILKKTLLKGVYEDAADVNGDGKINVTDFIKIKAALLKKDIIVGVTVK